MSANGAPHEMVALNVSKLTVFLRFSMNSPQQTGVIATPAMRRALIATNDQRVFRVYGPNGSVWKCERDGVSPRTLWWLLANDLIEDEPQTRVMTDTVTTIRMRLSTVGFDLLKAAIKGTGRSA